MMDNIHLSQQECTLSHETITSESLETHPV